MLAAMRYLLSLSRARLASERSANNATPSIISDPQILTHEPIWCGNSWSTETSQCYSPSLFLSLPSSKPMSMSLSPRCQCRGFARDNLSGLPLDIGSVCIYNKEGSIMDGRFLFAILLNLLSRWSLMEEKILMSMDNQNKVWLRLTSLATRRLRLTSHPNHTNISRVFKPYHLNITQPLTSHEVAESDHTPHEWPKPYHLCMTRVIKTIPSQRLTSIKTIPSWRLTSIKTIPSWRLTSIKTIPSWHLTSLKTIPSLLLTSMKPYHLNILGVWKPYHVEISLASWHLTNVKTILCTNLSSMKTVYHLWSSDNNHRIIRWLKDRKNH